LGIFIEYQVEIELSFEMTDSIFLCAPFIQRYLSCFSSKNLKIHITYVLSI